MMNALIIDDEIKHIENLTELLNSEFKDKIKLLKYSDIEIDKEKYTKDTRTINEAIEKITRFINIGTKIDLIFLDLDLAGGNNNDGLKVIEYLNKKNIKINIITVSSKSDLYANESDKFKRFPHIVKNVTKEKLEEALRALNELNRIYKLSDIYIEITEKSISFIKDKDRKQDRIKLKISDIYAVYINTEDKIVRPYTLISSNKRKEIIERKDLHFPIKKKSDFLNEYNMFVCLDNQNLAINTLNITKTANNKFFYKNTNKEVKIINTNSILDRLIKILDKFKF